MNRLTIFLFVVVCVSQVLAQTRSSLGFIFDCANEVCPRGPYQNWCTKCYTFDYPHEATALQCYCFDSELKLQSGSTLRYAQSCETIDVDSKGQLVCEPGATLPPTSIAIMPPDPVFNFNCIDDNKATKRCPEGDYRELCPLCIIDEFSTTTSTPSMSCMCFDENGEMSLEEQTIWKLDTCEQLHVDSGGVLLCIERVNDI